MTKLRRNITLSLHEQAETGDDGNNTSKRSTASIWRAQREGDKPTIGTLIQAGYRSAGLVVLVLQTEDTRCYTIPVWVDAVTAAQFSYLHYQIAFNAQPAQRPTLRAMLLPSHFQAPH